MKMHLQSFFVALLIFTVGCAGSEPSSKKQLSLRAKNNLYSRLPILSSYCVFRVRYPPNI